jgi:single-stranded DNA-binding protein
MEDRAPMIDALISGRLFGTAQPRTSKTGSPFVTCKVRVTHGEESIFVSVITFSTTVGKALAALSDGDSIALSGELQPRVWTDKEGNARPALDMTAHNVLTPYHIKRKRDAAASERKSEQSTAITVSETGTPFNDEIPF